MLNLDSQINLSSIIFIKIKYIIFHSYNVYLKKFEMTLLKHFDYFILNLAITFSIILNLKNLFKKKLFYIKFTSILNLMIIDIIKSFISIRILINIYFLLFSNKTCIILISIK